MSEHVSLKPNTAELSVNTSSKLVIGTGLCLIILLFGIGGFWAFSAKLSSAVIAQGRVIVLGQPKTIQHLDGGIIAKINVIDGDKVSKNDVLIKLDDTLLKTNINIYQNRLREGLARRARLYAERDLSNQIKWDSAILKLFNMSLDKTITLGQQKLFNARAETKLGQISQLLEKVKQFENQSTGITALKKSNMTQLMFLEDELKGIISLNKKGLVLKSQLLGLERQKEGMLGQNSEHDAELARIQNSISETRIQILQVDKEFRQSVLTELSQIEQEINDMTQQLHATNEQLKRVEIKAPVSGTIHQLNVFTIGGVIGPGAAVMQIIPQDNKFEIEANIEPQFVDELYPGQLATLRFSAFNQRSTPELSGTVKWISPDVVVNEQTGMSFYKIQISVTQEELALLKDHILIPGMPVEAFVKTGERTALNYLIKPLLDQINRAFKEE